MSQLKIHQYSYMSDNYGVLLHCTDSGDTTCIDCGDASATLRALEKTGWTLTEIWVTHHHADHTAGVMELKQSTGATVVGPDPISQAIDGLDKILTDGKTFSFAGHTVHAIHTPGHTKDMINFYIPDENIVFTGDTLFTMGCGRLFECDPATMYNSLAKLMALPAGTQVYSSHEYSLANIKFALTIDPENDALRSRARQIESLRADGLATVPSTLQEELDTNPFLRANDPKIREQLNMQTDDNVDVFAEIRKRKDNF